MKLLRLGVPEPWPCDTCPHGSWWPTPADLKWHLEQHHALIIKHCEPCAEFGLAIREHARHIRTVGHLSRTRESAQEMLEYGALVASIVVLVLLLAVDFGTGLAAWFAATSRMVTGT